MPHPISSTASASTSTAHLLSSDSPTSAAWPSSTSTASSPDTSPFDDTDRPASVSDFDANVRFFHGALGGVIPLALGAGATYLGRLVRSPPEGWGGTWGEHAVRTYLCEAAGMGLIAIAGLIYFYTWFHPVLISLPGGPYLERRLQSQHLTSHRILCVSAFFAFVFASILHILPRILYIVQYRRAPEALQGTSSYLGAAYITILILGILTAGLMRRGPRMHTDPLKLGTGYGVRGDETEEKEGAKSSALSIFSRISRKKLSGLSLGGSREEQADDHDSNVLDYSNCSMLSLLLLAYCARIAVRASQVTQLKQSDLPLLEEEVRKAGLSAFDDLSRGPTGEVTSWGLVKVLWWPLRWKIFITFIVETVCLFFGYIRMIALHEIIDALKSDSDDKSYAYLMCWGLFVGQSLQVIISAYSWVRENYLLHNPVRLSLSAMLFAKILRTADAKAMEAHNASEAGAAQDYKKGRAQVMNLLTIDIGTVASMATYLWNTTNPLIGLVFGLIFIYRMFGVSAFVGITMVPLTAPVTVWMTAAMYRCDRAWSRARDARIAAIKEMLVGIKVVKLNAFEKYERARIERLRNQEIVWQLWRFRLGAFWNMVSDQMPGLAIMATFWFHTKVMGNSLDPATAFVAVGVFGYVRSGLENLPYSIDRFLATKIALDRIKSYLNQAEIDLTVPDPFDTTVACRDAQIAWPTGQKSEDSIKAASAVEGSNEKVFKLRNVNVDLPVGKMTLVSGPLGAGKTLFLRALLGEAVIESGSVVAPRSAPDFTPVQTSESKLAWSNELWLKNSIAYASQQPYIRHGTVRDNIVFGQPFWEERYEETLKQCSLLGDLTLLVDGDLTEVGEHGVNLSGGQKARINLARCVYSRAKTIYLDDILSAVDAHTAQYLVNECFKGSLLRDRTVVLVSHHIELCLPAADLFISLKNGTVDQAVPASEAKIADLEDVKSPPISPSVAIEQIPEVIGLGDVAKTVGAEKKGGESDRERRASLRVLYKAEHQAEGRVAVSHYMLLIVASGGILWLTPFMIMTTGAKIFDVAGSWTLQRWAEDTDPSRLDYYLQIYIFYVVAGALFASLRWIWLYGISRNSAMGWYSAGTTKVHRMLMDTICAAPLSFFESTPAGRLMNVFGQDMWRLDAGSADDFGRTVMQVIRLAAGVLVVGTQEPWMLLVFAFFFVPLYYISKLLGVLRTSLRRLNAIADSPLITLYHNAIDGVVMVRAFGTNKVMASAMMTLINRARTATIADNVSYNWVRSVATSSTSVVVSATSFVLVSRGVSPALTGFILMFALSLSNDIFALLERFTNLEQTLVSAERVNNYIQMPAKESTDGDIPPPSWPSRGHVKFQNLSLRYADDLPDVLHNISFEVEPGQRVGIVGATGSGKSTLALSLFRGVEAHEGTIEVDGTDVSTLALHELRGRLNMVAQDGTLSSGTLREALDVTAAKDDHEIYAVLQRVHLLPEILTEVDVKENPFANLDSFVAAEGANFSQGQRQLLCLARALLKTSKVLVMDEATSSVDFEMDAKITQTIKECFAGTTMIVIAHRLATIINYDKVLVLEQGRILEYGRPVDMMKNPESAFARLCMAQGKDEYERLLSLTIPRV